MKPPRQTAKKVKTQNHRKATPALDRLPGRYRLEKGKAKRSIFLFRCIKHNRSRRRGKFRIGGSKNYTLDLPIVIDCEHKTDRVSGLSNAERTDNVLAFLATVQAKGYSACLYTGHYFYNNLLEHQRLSSVKLWIAYYTNNPDKVADVNYTYWQYTDSGAVAGISGNVDMNVWVYK